MDSVEFGDSSVLLKNTLDDRAYGKIAILVDDNTSKHCLPLIQHTLGDFTHIEVSHGEVNKNLDSCQQIWERLTRGEFSRNDLMINLGGGVISDMGGFCASTFKRGMDFINIPTTLLAQVDASIGGKLGVDFMGYKNHIGLFNKPEKVFIDTKYLKTLPERELKSGFAEVIKHSLLNGTDHWNEIRQFNWNTSWDDLIKKSIKVKSDIVASDYKEAGLRKVLNFGHTIGHGVESHFLGGEHTLLHGEAIAAGMIMELWLSSKVLSLETEVRDEIVEYLLSLYGKVNSGELNQEEIIKLMRMDKKNRDNKILFALLKGLGNAQYDVAITEELVSQSLDYYNNL